MLNTITNDISTADQQTHSPKLWMPERVLFTPAALNEPWGQQIFARVQALNLPIEELRHNRLTIMPIDDWQMHYSQLFDSISSALDINCNLTFELISHRFTPGSKEVLQIWYPRSQLDMDEAKRSVKRNKFGGIKYIYNTDIMKTMKCFFENEIQKRFPKAKILYWT